ncbi:hypothetical protein CAI21_18355 [Alkalilimnicola ehrlichii]|uniref:Uncharacterized protein n=1 Tax=Alkalilimnicola ehrlichii TaxID=351052 RepID=A0A3E0WSF7_9GAMM|nr:hypothetical protein [Alkalilimnicola ehrlichii]RFA25818.1 hypothetical protein CAI21_18355 [Alkalilimnicola ehrlichii]RFA35081.1 hypothetical protein CAL65_13290 [Alkalilimnicola ehrlichii]
MRWIDSDGRQDLLAGSHIRFETLSSRDAVHAAAGGVIQGQHIDSGTDVTLDALDSVLVDYVISVGDQNIEADNRVAFRELVANGDIRVGAVQGIQGERAMADGLLRLMAGDRRHNGSLHNADLALDYVRGEAVRLYAGGRIGGHDADTPLDVAVGRELSLVGQQIAVDATQTGFDTLALDMVGANHGLADYAWLRLTTDAAVEAGQVHVEQAELVTNTSRLRINDAEVAHWLDLQTGQLHAYINNIDPRLRPVHVQIYEPYEPDTRFALDIDGRALWTDAYVSYYRPGWQVDTPTYSTDRDAWHRDVEGRSIESDLNRDLRTLAKHVEPGFVLPTPAMPARVNAWGPGDAAPRVRVGLVSIRGLEEELTVSEQETAGEEI